MIDVLCEITIASHGALEHLQHRGRGILEIARRRRRPLPRAHALGAAETLFRREVHEAIGLLATYIEDSEIDEHYLNEVGAEVRIIAERMECFPREPLPPPPSNDISVQLTRINHAVDAEAAMIYQLKDTGQPSATTYLRRRGLHLLELGMLETEQAGIDITAIRSAISTAFNIPNQTNSESRGLCR
ncbi:MULTISPECIES: hypothetical protein [Prauserella]|uniref:Uncharacterized protein n=2 Tax=Prauserella TaxID=142577 RepID=A0A318L988_9PSEU|nr:MULTISPECIES: hypothetical protein [Prauserella]PXY17732.1 hypothetical protein BA062_36880 [Prauserella flavalba]TKG63570.1 hypothetical protein FCN18_30180 [Prauserella endophytica]